MALDVLCLAAHPDDVELSMGGTACLLVKQGYRVGAVDFTRGELGTRGTPELRLQEAEAAAKIIGLSVRENLGLPDGDLAVTPERRLAVVRAIRRHRPHVCLVTAPDDRHPDHPAAARLAADAIFAAGLAKVETAEDDGTPQEPWRPHHTLHYMQTLEFEPTFVVDVSEVWEQRLAALFAFRSQFLDPRKPADAQPDEPATFLANPDFLAFVEGRARHYGFRIGATYGEPFLYKHGPVGVTDLMRTLERERPWR